MKALIYVFATLLPPDFFKSQTKEENPRGMDVFA